MSQALLNHHLPAVFPAVLSPVQGLPWPCPCPRPSLPPAPPAAWDFSWPTGCCIIHRGPSCLGPGCFDLFQLSPPFLCVCSSSADSNLTSFVASVASTFWFSCRVSFCVRPLPASCARATARLVYICVWTHVPSPSAVSFLRAGAVALKTHYRLSPSYNNDMIYGLQRLSVPM